ncbi:hypothetical protein J6590_036634, partial [Homalodisca vitripennis]
LAPRVRSVLEDFLDSTVWRTPLSHRDRSESREEPVMVQDQAEYHQLACFLSSAT